MQNFIAETKWFEIYLCIYLKFLYHMVCIVVFMSDFFIKHQHSQRFWRDVLRRTDVNWTTIIFAGYALPLSKYEYPAPLVNESCLPNQYLWQQSYTNLCIVVRWSIRQKWIRVSAVYVLCDSENTCTAEMQRDAWLVRSQLRCRWHCSCFVICYVAFFTQKIGEERDSES